MRENAGKDVFVGQPFQRQVFLDNLHDKDKNSPQDKIPCGAVPEANKKPHDKQIENRAKLSLSIPAERNINILSKPAS